MDSALNTLAGTWTISAPLFVASLRSLSARVTHEAPVGWDVKEIEFISIYLFS